jgi:hypothetical protein
MTIPAEIAWYKLDGDGDDASGNALHASNVGTPVYITGKVSQGLAATAANGLSVADNALLDIGASEDFAVAFWVRYKDVGWQVRKKATQSSASDAGWGFYSFAGSNMVFLVADGGVRVFATSGSGVVDDGNWHHVVWAFDRPADTLRLWVDGASVSTSIIEGPVSSVGNASNSQPLKMTADGAVDLDDVRIFKTVPTDGQVAALYNAAAGASRSLAETINATTPLTSQVIL